MKFITILKNICICRNCRLYKKGLYISIVNENRIDEFYIDSLLFLYKYQEAYQELKKIRIKKNKIFESIFGKILAYDISKFPDYEEYIKLFPELYSFTKEIYKENFKNKELQSYLKKYEKYSINTRSDTGIFSIKKIKNKVHHYRSTTPKLSILMTAHNEEKYIATAIQSIRSQTFKEFELIIVNDGSTDNTLKIITKFAKRDQRIKIINLQENVGLWRAKNTGLKYCNADIITMHDADDWSHPEKMKMQFEITNKSTKRITTSYLVRIAESNGLLFSRNYNSFLRWNPSSLMFHKEALSTCGNFITDLLGSDAEYIQRLELYYNKKNHIKIKLPLTIAMNRECSLSNQFRCKKIYKRLKDWELWNKIHRDSKNLYFMDKSISNIYKG